MKFLPSYSIVPSSHNGWKSDSSEKRRGKVSHQHNEVGLGLLLPDEGADCPDALCDVPRGVAVVVGADEEDDDARGDALQLAVLQPPEEVLGAVAADAEVEAVHLREGGEKKLVVRNSTIGG